MEYKNTAGDLVVRLVDPVRRALNIRGGKMFYDKAIRNSGRRLIILDFVLYNAIV